MKENSSLATPCETAAVRIQCWFGRDKEHRLLIQQSLAPPKEFSKKHKCDLVKTPRIPPQIEQLPVHGYSLAKRKKQTKSRLITKDTPIQSLKITIEPNTCSVSQKYYSRMRRHSTLCSERVASWRLKEHFLVCKRLKILSKQRPIGSKRLQATQISSSPPSSPPSSNPYEEWTKIQEEHHFQIDRVIKYL